MIKGRNPEEKNLIEKILKFNQGHLFHFWEELDNTGKDSLINDIRSIDLEVVKRAMNLVSRKENRQRKISPPQIIALPASEEENEKRKKADEVGTRYLKSSKVAVFTAAGGQSSRLGLNIPKGAFRVTPIKKKSLFQVHAEKILFMQKKYQSQIPWLIMVSETNRDQTLEFFQKNHFFGLDEDSVRFIEQGMYPAFDEQGKIFLKSKNSVFLSPSGHGGTFQALNDSGALTWLKESGIEEIFYFQVDNVLVKVLDPVFIGYHVSNKCEMSSKCVSKRDPMEKLGVFVVEDGKVTVVEYSELSGLLSDSTDFTVESYSAGSIAIHMLNVDFAKKMGEGVYTLPLHLAHKAIPYTDSSGKRVVTDRPNGYKAETFIFDALKKVTSTIIMEVRRDIEFSPLKNKSGEDSPQTVFEDQLRLFAQWFNIVGISVPHNDRALPLYKLEVSPLFASMEEDFLEKVVPDIVVDKDTYLG
jgi:UDP-N-acetylglucosamine/UDP-N-acetylgalactosamine diphosphorylase